MEVILDGAKSLTSEGTTRKRGNKINTGLSSIHSISSLRFRDYMTSCEESFQKYKATMRKVDSSRTPIENINTVDAVIAICNKQGLQYQEDPGKLTIILELTTIDVVFDMANQPTEVFMEFCIESHDTKKVQLPDILNHLKLHQFREAEEKICIIRSVDSVPKENENIRLENFQLEEIVQQFLRETPLLSNIISIRLSDGVHLYFHPNNLKVDGLGSSGEYEYLETSYKNKAIVAWGSSISGERFLKLSPPIQVPLISTELLPGLCPQDSIVSYAQLASAVYQHHGVLPTQKGKTNESRVVMKLRDREFSLFVYEPDPRYFSVSSVRISSVREFTSILQSVFRLIAFEKLKSSLQNNDMMLPAPTSCHAVEVWVYVPYQITITWVGPDKTTFKGLQISVESDGSYALKKLPEGSDWNCPLIYLQKVLAKTGSLPHLIYYAISEDFASGM
eukprot:TRINITY_DN6954_c0_g1_i3.p1 TRINITY_DN6954_c0_g1~~TRINITY_DN6954_c0_g1_i3.p1  ORF type:complete len:449 (-),score=73.31 TRINITY_DN6954_c0_g1_i3:344-1690(-)